MIISSHSDNTKPSLDFYDYRSYLSGDEYINFEFCPEPGVTSTTFYITIPCAPTSPNQPNYSFTIYVTTKANLWRSVPIVSSSPYSFPGMLIGSSRFQLR